MQPIRVMEGVFQGDQTPHAVAVKEERQAAVLGLQLANEKPSVLAVVLPGSDRASDALRAAMSPEIVSGHDEASWNQRLDNIPIAPAVLAETVDQSHHSLCPLAGQPALAKERCSVQRLEAIRSMIHVTLLPVSVRALS